MKFEAFTQEWKTFTIDEIKADTPNALATGPFGSSIGPRFFESYGVPVVRGTNLSEDISVRLSHENIAFMSVEKSRDFERSKARKGDLIFTSRGSVGQVGLIDKNCPYPEYVISNNMMKLSPNTKKADSNFLYYLFSSPLMVDEIRNQTIGTSVPGFNLGQLRSLNIRLPPLPEQRAIARILGSLDDKIELNRRMNETLEALARTIFKSWFVDFDPVRARAEGRAPAGMDAETAALFPDGFEESEGRMVPEGWRVGRVSDLCSAIYSGGTPRTDKPEYWDGDISWLSSGETREKFIIGTKRRITIDGVSNSSARLAPTQSTVIASAGQGNTRGQTSMLAIDSYINQSVVALAAKPEISSQYHLFFDLERRYEEFRRISDAHSSRGSLTTKLLAGLNATIPEHSVIQCFDGVVGAAIERVTGNLQESHTLAALRDSLLSKLISGEIPIRDTKTLLL